MNRLDPQSEVQPPAPALSGSRHPSLWKRTPHRAEDFFDASTLAQARDYARPVNRVRVVRGTVGLVVVAAFVLGQAGPRLLEALQLGVWPLEVAVVVLAFVVAGAAASIGFDAWLTLVHDRRHGLSTQSTGGFLADSLKEVMLSAALLTTLLVPVLAVIRATDAWWLGGWAIATAFATTLALVYPVLILPRFNRFEPLGDGDLLRRLQAVADRAGEPIESVQVMDASRRTTRDNAFVAGFGPTKRVVLFDTLLEHPPEVIEQIVAHEIGHYRLRHIPKSIAFQAALFLAVFAFVGWFTSWQPALDAAGVAHAGEPGAVPLVLVGLGIGVAVTSFAGAFYSRAKERQADLEALELLGRPEDFVELWRRLAPKNKAELQPAWWRRLLASHPEIPERMSFGTRWAELNGPALR
jgi:STE24 endopeptidase